MHLHRSSGQANPSWDRWLEKWFLWLTVTGILVNISGLFVTILEPDGALYATIAKTIAQSGDFINLKVEGKDWLDKPHFPFWITALSFKAFGVSTFSYKLPALLFWAVGGLYTFLFTAELYTKNIARLSVLIYLTAAHLVISNNDVRAEPYLTGLVIGSVFHFYKASGKGLSFHLLAGSILAACAVMTKGPFVLIVIGSGFIIDWMLKKDWKQFLHYRWWLASLLILLFILPEIYSLYRQFDQHPEKIVFNRTGVSGITFFFWESQFGRFLNTGPIKGKGDLFFYVHTILWAFLPWSILLVAAIFHRIKNHNNKNPSNENIAIGASLVTFALFSLSRFQLPHYMNIVFPFFSIITAQYVYGIHRNNVIRVWSWIQNSILLLLVALLLVLSVLWNFPNVALIICGILGFSVMILFIFRKHGMTAIFGRTFMISVLLFSFLNLIFYPALLHYQSGSKAAALINTYKPGKPVCTYLENSYSFAFYTREPIEYHQSPESLKKRAGEQELLVFTSKGHLNTLAQSGLTVRQLGTFPHFHISQLTLRFLNFRTRESVTELRVIALVSAGNQTTSALIP